MTGSRQDVIKGLVVAVLGGLLVWQLVAGGGSRPARDHPGTAPLSTGDSVPDVRIASLRTGDAARLRHLVGRGCHLVYVFDPTCPACRSAKADWEDADSLTIPQTRTILWLSIGSTADSSRAFVRDVDVPFPAYFLAPELRPLGIGATPGVWGVEDGVIRYRRTGRSLTNPSTLTEESGWCERGSRDTAGSRSRSRGVLPSGAGAPG